MRSNFFNSEVSKPLSIEIRDIRINKMLENEDQETDLEDLINNSKQITDLHTYKKVPATLITFVQVYFLSILQVSGSMHFLNFSFLHFM